MQTPEKYNRILESIHADVDLKRVLHHVVLKPYDVERGECDCAAMQAMVILWQSASEKARAKAWKAIKREMGMD